MHSRPNCKLICTRAQIANKFANNTSCHISPQEDFDVSVLELHQQSTPMDEQKEAEAEVADGAANFLPAKAEAADPDYDPEDVKPLRLRYQRRPKPDAGFEEFKRRVVAETRTRHPDRFGQLDDRAMDRMCADKWDGLGPDLKAR